MMSLMAASASSVKNLPEPKIMSYLVLSRLNEAVTVLFALS